MLLPWSIRMLNTLSLFGTLAVSQALFGEQPCEKLTDLKLPNAEVTSAVSIPAAAVSTGTGNAPPIDMPSAVLLRPSRVLSRTLKSRWKSGFRRPTGTEGTADQQWRLGWDDPDFVVSQRDPAWLRRCGIKWRSRRRWYGRSGGLGHRPSGKADRFRTYQCDE